MKKSKTPKVAIVHDSIRFFGGAERVLVSLFRAYPDADVYTSVVAWDKLGPFKKNVATLHPKTSFLQKIALFRNYPFLFRYLLPFVWASFDFSSYDVVISSSGAQMSHLIHVPEAIPHICYSHTPPRHLYGFATDFAWQQYPFIKQIAAVGNYFLRKKDYVASQRVTLFIANSHEVARRINRNYHRMATVLYPPVHLSPASKVKKKSGAYYLAVSRLSRMKHVDIIIEACQALGRPLRIVGTGPEQDRLKKLITETTLLLGQVNDQDLLTLYSECKGVICGAENEDFGIVPVEAMSVGKAVIALDSGGFRETVIPQKTGILFPSAKKEVLMRAMRDFEAQTFSARALRHQGEKFSEENFLKNIRLIVTSVLAPEKRTRKSRIQ